MPTRELRVVLIGDDASLNRALGRSAAGAETFGKRMDAVSHKMTATGRTMTHSLTLPIVVAAGASIKFAADFQRSMELVHTQAGASQHEVDRMSKSILALSPAVATGPNELAKALYHIESVGVRGAAALDVLKNAALGAKVGNADLEATTNALSAAWVVGIQGASNMKVAMGTLNAIVGVGNMRMNDLASAMGTGILPVAKNFGLSLRSVGAALATMTDAGVPAVDAATRLRMTFSLLAAPTAKATKELATIKLGAFDLANAMRQPDGLVKAIQLLHDHLQGLSKTQQAAVLTGAFGGGRSSATIITLVNNLTRLQTKYDAIAKGVSKYGDAVKHTTETDHFKFDQSLAQLQSTGISMGATLLPVLVTLAGDVQGVAHAFSTLSPEMQHVVVDGALVVAALGPILTVGGNVAKVVGLMGTAYTKLTPAAAAASTAVASVSAPAVVGATEMTGFAVGMGAADTAAVGATVGVAGLTAGAALLTGGAALAVVGIAALAIKFSEGGDAASRMASTVAGLKVAIDGVASSSRAAQDANLAYKQAQVDLSTTSLALTAAQHAYAKTLQQEPHNITAVKTAFDALVQARINHSHALLNLTDRVNAYDAASKTATQDEKAALNTVKTATEAYRKLNDSLGSGAKAEQVRLVATKQYTDTLHAQADALRASAAKVDAYNPKLAALERKEAAAADKAANLTTNLNNLPTSKDIQISLRVNELISQHGAAGSTIPAHKAAGGPVSAGVLYQVNESHVEYFRPSVDGAVIPLAPDRTLRDAGRPSRGAGAPPLVVNQYFRASPDPRAMQAEAAWNLRRLLPHAVA